jgi:hypothetical protein
MKRNGFSKLIIAVVVTLNVLFAIGDLYAFLKVGTEPVTLTGCWFGFTTGELWMLSSIKKTKVKKKGTGDE